MAEQLLNDPGYIAAYLDIPITKGAQVVRELTISTGFDPEEVLSRISGFGGLAALPSVPDPFPGPSCLHSRL